MKHMLVSRLHKYDADFIKHTSATPKNKRAAARPEKLVTKPMQVMTMPQRTMMIGLKTDGFRRFSRMLVSKWFEASVRNEEERKRGLVLPVRRLQVCDQAIDLRIADVRTIEEGHEVEECWPWDQLAIEFAEQLFVLVDVKLMIPVSTSRLSYDFCSLFFALSSIWVVQIAEQYSVFEVLLVAGGARRAIALYSTLSI